MAKLANFRDLLAILPHHGGHFGGLLGWKRGNFGKGTAAAKIAMVDSF